MSKILKNLIPWLLATAGSFAPSTAFAAPGWTAPTLISELVVRENGIDIIVVTGSNPVPCPSSTYFRLSATAQNYEVIVSTILSAQARGRPVQMWASSCTTDGFSEIVAIWVK